MVLFYGLSGSGSGSAAEATTDGAVALGEGSNNASEKR